MNTRDSIALDKLVKSIKNRKHDPNNVTNISCFYQNRLIIWNDDDQCLYSCFVDEQHKIHDIQIVALSSFPAFHINMLTISPSGHYLALHGTGGVMIAEMPRNLNVNRNRSENNKLLIRSFTLAERMFLCKRSLKLHCIRWHPVSKRHLALLTNDNYLRIFDIDDEYEPIKTINLYSENQPNIENYFTDSFNKNYISFDFGPSLSKYEFLDENNSLLLDIYPIYVLKENGDVILLFLNLNDLSDTSQTYRPLKMLPAAEDNYGSEACTILCLDCVPPVIVIGTSSGLLYHCIAIENDIDENCNEKSETFYIRYKQKTFVIPEIILYVLESIELSFPLASYQEDDSINHLNINNSLRLISDKNDPKRYFCMHSFGVHAILISFLKQLMNQSITDFHDEKSIVEYLICTRPIIDDNKSDSTYPLGIVLNINMGFTTITILLSTGELISKRLSNVVFEIINDDPIFIKDLCQKNDYLLEQNRDKKCNFSQHINNILTKNVNLPLIKSSKSVDAFPAQLEMLINSIDVLKSEYILKYNLASQAIKKRKSVLNSDVNFQLKEIEKLKQEKDLLLKNYVRLVDKYDFIKDKSNMLTFRLEKIFANTQNQRPTLSDAELKLKDEMDKELKNLSVYVEQFDQIKQKRQYQEAQFKKFSPYKSKSNCLENNMGIQSQHIIKNIKKMLTQQGDAIAELIRLIKLAKKISTENID